MGRCAPEDCAIRLLVSTPGDDGLSRVWLYREVGDYGGGDVRGRRSNAAKPGINAEGSQTFYEEINVIIIYKESGAKEAFKDFSANFIFFLFALIFVPVFPVIIIIPFNLLFPVLTSVPVVIVVSGM